MPIFLYGVGTVVAALGAAMIGFGIPNNEFGIGNTLIVAGTTAVSAGLIVIALGVAVAQLQRVIDALATRPAVRSSRPFDTFDPAAAARPSAAPPRVPFPPKTKAESRGAETRMEMPQPPTSWHAETSAQDVAPALPNPDEPPVTVADEALSPLHPSFPRAPQVEPESEVSGQHRDEHLPPPPPARKPKTYFDAMWPAEAKSPEPPKLGESRSVEPKFVEAKSVEGKSVEAKSVEAKSVETKSVETKFVEPSSAEFTPAEFKEQPAELKAPEFQWSDVRRGEPHVADASAPEEPDEEDAPRAVAILKSGVVDGMGYTLYVDGSIEAELPQGTLRFASINELRSHLEKTS